MRLGSIKIHGFRSVKESLTLNCDARVTVILGANDHGKSNILDAIKYLNSDQKFDPDKDLNWDCDKLGETLPRIEFNFELDESDKDEFAALAKLYQAYEFAEKEIEAVKEEHERVASEATATSNDLAELQKKLSQSVATLNEKQKLLGQSATEENKAAVGALVREQADINHLKSTTEEKLKGLRLQEQATQNILSLHQISLLVINDVIQSESPHIDVEKAIADHRSKISRDLAKSSNRISELANQIASEKKKLDDAAAAGQPLDTQVQKRHADLTKSHKALTSRISALTETGKKYDELNKTDQGKELATFVGSLSDRANAKPIRSILVRRAGIAGDLELEVPESYNHLDIQTFIKKKLPRVEILRPFAQVEDKVGLEKLRDDEYTFMRGIFYYAGIQQNEWNGIFERTDITQRRLAEASKNLTKVLSETWSQGQELRFDLSHDSKTGEIDLRIEDPSVQGRYVRASRRSSGFTYFFAMKTILHARTEEAKAASYIWLFDEPGLYLHPYGQHDLLSALETLSRNNQIIYSTHSMFMINKNHPTRHRLVVKDDKGTRIDGKPYVGHWRAAIDALGLALPGTILFANYILLVEGDSDPIFLNALLQKFVDAGLVDMDLNSFSIVSTGESRNADALVKILADSAVKPKLAALFDGDDGGRSRADKLRPILKKYKGKVWNLENKLTIEDCLPFIRAVYIPSVGRYVANISGKAECEKELLNQYDKDYGKNPDAPEGIAKWSRKKSKEIGDLAEEPSPVGIAREYAIALSNFSIEKEKMSEQFARALTLAKSIVEQLGLPGELAKQEQIIEE